MGAVYLFHDLFGYLMEMSPDIAELIEAFADGADTARDDRAVPRPVRRRRSGAVRRRARSAHSVLVEPDEDEIERDLAVRCRSRASGTSGSAAASGSCCGPRGAIARSPQVMLDAEETAMWDAFDGEKRLDELRLSVRRRQARRARAAAHPQRRPGAEAVDDAVVDLREAARAGAAVPRRRRCRIGRGSRARRCPRRSRSTDYYRNEVGDADAQFDHHETTLSHLLRVPHPALRGRTYGQALVDALVARGAIREGSVRVLEIGAGLGYVARDVIARLRAAGRTVSYTIVELAPALAEAQQRARRQRRDLGRSATR